MSIRSNSPTPSATAASSGSGATIPKQTFFAKLKTFGPPHHRDPISSSSEDEKSRTPKVSSKPSIFANVVPTIKESSLGSLLVRRGDKSMQNKAAIDKPRPIMPSLGGYLVCDHAEQVARAAASGDIISRQETTELALLEVPQSSTLGGIAPFLLSKHHRLSRQSLLPLPSRDAQSIVLNIKIRAIYLDSRPRLSNFFLCVLYAPRLHLRRVRVKASPPHPRVSRLETISGALER
jgi:hypothetical protein